MFNRCFSVLRVRLGGRMRAFRAVRCSPWPSANARLCLIDASPPEQRLVGAPSSTHFPFNHSDITKNPQIPADVPSVRLERRLTHTHASMCDWCVFRTQRPMRVSTVCSTVASPWRVTLPPHFTQSYMNLFGIRVNDFLYCYLPLESFYGNIITCLISRVCYYPGLIFLSAHLSLWPWCLCMRSTGQDVRKPLQSLCNCYTGTADCACQCMILHNDFVFGFSKILKWTLKRKHLQLIICKDAVFSWYPTREKKENYRILLLQLFPSFKAEQQIRRLCYFAIFSSECAKEMCQQMQWV